MKTYLILTLIGLGLSPSLRAEEETKKSSISDLRKDFELICELSKLEDRLLKSKAFREQTAEKAQEADLLVRVGKMLQAGTVTPEVKNTYDAITNADPKSKEKLWHDSAKQSGVKGWSCPGIGSHL